MSPLTATASMRCTGTRSSALSTDSAWAPQRGAEGVDRRRVDLQAGRGAVAAVAAEVLRAGLEAAEQVERRDRSRRPGRPALAVDRDHHRGPVVALDEPRGDDPRHPRMPALRGDDVREPARLLTHLRLGLVQHPLLDLAALVVDAIELLGDRLRAIGVGGEDELEARVGALEPAGGVDARGEAERDRPGVEPRSVAAGDGHQRAQAGSSGRAQRLQASRTRRRFSPRSATGRRRPSRARRGRSSAAVAAPSASASLCATPAAHRSGHG
ncbi:MAG: hypothetical protein R2736_12050 [Solirubrobacterales bacterium]